MEIEKSKLRWEFCDNFLTYFSLKTSPFDFLKLFRIITLFMRNLRFLFERKRKRERRRDRVREK